MGILGQLSPDAAGVAHLTLAIGVGPLGSIVGNELERLLSQADQGARLAVRVSSAESDPSPRAAAQQLLSSKNMDQLEQAGRQIPSRRVGQALRLHLVLVLDLSDSDALAHTKRVLSDLEGLDIQRSLVGVLTGLPKEDEILSHSAITEFGWDWVLPVPSQSAVAGVHSGVDIALSLARTILLLITSSRDGFGEPFLPPPSSIPEGGGILHVGASFLDGASEDLVECVAKPIAGRLLALQFDQPRPHEPAASLDDEQRTKSLDQLNLERLAHRLLSGTPFRLEAESGQPWRVILPPGILSTAIETAPRRRWVAVLLKHRDLFDFTKGRRWAESMESAEVDLRSTLETQIAKDIEQLHRYTRGPDRVLAFATRVRTILETQPDIARPRGSDFDGAIQDLRDQIAESPNQVAVLARAALLGWLGAEAVRLILAHWMGSTAAWAAFAVTWLFAAVLGLRSVERAHDSLHRALRVAQESLLRRYELQARENLVLLLTRLRDALLSRLDEEIGSLHEQAKVAMELSRQLEADYGRDEDADLVLVEWVVPFCYRSGLLEWLQPSWHSLHDSAAREGALVPVPASGEQALKTTVEPLLEFARKYLRARPEDLGLARLVEFRATVDSSFQTRIVNDLDRRAALQASRGPTLTIWCGPEEILSKFDSQIATRNEGALRIPGPARMLACVKRESIVIRIAEAGR